jgi:TonB family protein
MPVPTSKSVAPPERRVHARQRMDSIAYLDIGPDNGGIVLNLSEEGMAVQVVSHLDKQADIRLKVKLPNSQARIELTARIIWLNESSRRAGMRFLAAQPEGHDQIQEWIRSQTSPRAPLEESPKVMEEVKESQPKQEPIRELRRNKWLGSRSEFEFPELSRQKSPEAAGDVTEHRVPTAQEEPASFQKPELVTQSSAEPAISLPAERPAMQEESPQAAPLQAPVAPTRSEPDNGDAAIAAPSHDESRQESTLGWPTPISRTAAMAIPLRPDPSLRPVELLASAFESKANSTPPILDTILAAPAATNRTILWNRVAIAVLFVLCSVLCFGIGTWVGQIVTRRHSAKAAAAQVNVVPTAEPGINMSAAPNAGRLAPATTQKVHAGPAPRRSAVQNRQVAPAMTFPEVPPVPQDAASNPPEQNVVPLATTKEQESNPPVAPVPQNSVAAASSQRVVGGLVLKPSDRFNPCYLAYRVEAAYPAEAQEQRIEGVVKIQQVVGTDGIVRSVKLLSGSPLLAPAALEAARYWRYLPALLNGQPVETEQDVEIEFRLPH